MSHSHAFDAERSCPACGGVFTAQIWAVIDAAARPDLVDRLCSGELSITTCPHCGASVPLPEILMLIYRQGEQPAIFVVHTDEPPEEIQEIGSMLLGGLRDSFGPEWDDELASGIPLVHRDQMTARLLLERQIPFDVEPDVGDEGLAELVAAARECSPVNTPSSFAFMHMTIASRYSDGGVADPSIALDRAIHHYKVAAAALSHDEEMWAGAQLSLSYAYTRRPIGDHADNAARAVEHAEAALAVLPDPDRNRAQALTNMGLALMNRQSGDRAADFERAIAALEEATGIFAVIGSPADQAVVDINLAQAYTLRQDSNSARDDERAFVAAGRAVEALLAVGDQAGAATALMNLGNVHAMRRNRSDADLSEAIDAYERALSLLPASATHHDRAGIHMNLGKAYRDLAALSHDQNLAAAAHDHFQHALDLTGPDRDPLTWALTLENSVPLYLESETADREEGRHRLVTAANIAIEAGGLRDGLRMLGTLGAMWCEDDKWPEAAETLHRAADVHEQLLAETYSAAGQLVEIADGARVHTVLAYALLKLGRIGEALERLEEGKTRLFRESLAINGVDLMMLPDEQAEELHRARVRLARLTELDEDRHEFVPARRDLRSLITRLRAHHPRAFPSAPRLDTILGLAPEGGALVIPLVTPSGGAVVVIPGGAATVTADDVVWLPEFDSNALHGLLLGRSYALEDDHVFDAVLGAVSSTITLAYVAQSEAEMVNLMWTTIMGAVDERLREGSPVMILPHGGIGMLPLHAAAPSPDDTTFLDRHPVAYAPSAAALVDSMARQTTEPANTRLLALADPTLDLPYAAVEADVVGAFFPAADRTILKGTDARAAALAHHIGDAAYLHLACHAAYDWNSTMDSSLLLAGGETFALADMAALPRLDHVRMVSLSGCETGASEIRAAADEYRGFPLAFHQAGVPLVLSTLWPVNDAAAAFLMGRFFQEHLVGGQPPSQALRSAQLWLRNASRADLVAWLEDSGRGARNVRVELLKEELRDDWRPEERPFRGLGHWAAFTMSGHSVPVSAP